MPSTAPPSFLNHHTHTHTHTYTQGEAYLVAGLLCRSRHHSSGLFNGYGASTGYWNRLKSVDLNQNPGLGDIYARPPPPLFVPPSVLLQSLSRPLGLDGIRAIAAALDPLAYTDGRPGCASIGGLSLCASLTNMDPGEHLTVS